MHSRCRCTISAVVESGKRTAKVAGKNIRVPAEMKYADFKAVYIDKTRSFENWKVFHTVKIPLQIQALGAAVIPTAKLTQYALNPEKDTNKARAFEAALGYNLDNVEKLIENGMNCARFNFSHGDHEGHLKRINRVREAAKKSKTVISLILDTKGPEMRLGEFKNGSVDLVAGNKFTLTQSDEPGDETHVGVSHKLLYTEVKPGDKLLLSDGLVEILVDEIKDKDIVTTILNSGKMSTRKRVAAPGVELGLPAISEQDEKDIIFGIENDMDFIAASFIQRASDVEQIRDLVARHGGHMEIIPKIENLAGVQNIDEIIAAAA